MKNYTCSSDGKFCKYTNPVPPSSNVNFFNSCSILAKENDSLFSKSSRNF